WVIRRRAEAVDLRIAPLLDVVTSGTHGVCHAHQRGVAAAVVAVAAGARGSVRGLLRGVVLRPGVAGLALPVAGVVVAESVQPVLGAERREGLVASAALGVPGGVDGGDRPARVAELARVGAEPAADRPGHGQDERDGRQPELGPHDRVGLLVVVQGDAGRPLLAGLPLWPGGFARFTHGAVFLLARRSPPAVTSTSAPRRRGRT